MSTSREGGGEGPPTADGGDHVKFTIIFKRRVGTGRKGLTVATKAKSLSTPWEVSERWRMD